MKYQIENQGSSGEDNIETRKPENFNDLVDYIRIAKLKARKTGEQVWLEILIQPEKTITYK